MDGIEEEDDRLVTAFFINIFAQLLTHVQFWFDWVTSLVRFQPQTGEGFQPRNIINNLINNLCSEEIKLIQPNETAEDAFQRKISERDYDSAKKLAKKFDFDEELIYQNMWKRETINSELILSCLGSSKNMLWILEQCCNYVPTEYQILKDLLTFGIERSNDNIFSNELKTNESQEEGEEKVKQNSKALDFVRYRNILLLFNSRLKLYEMILYRHFGDEFPSHFEPEFFASIRFKTVFQLSIEFANQSQIDALEILICLENKNLHKHLLTILSNLPETLPPSEYKIIFQMLFESKEASTENKDVIFYEDQILQSRFEQQFYEENIDFKTIETHNNETYREILVKWFHERSVIIAEFTMLIENSLSLLNFGITNGLNELEDIFTEMDIYSMLIYEAGSSVVSFTEFQQMTHFQKMNLIFEKQDPVYCLEVMFEQFLTKLKRFKKQDESDKVDRKQFLREFVVTLARNDFEKCVQIFRNYSMADKTLEEINKLKGITNAVELIELALECLRAYSKFEQLENAFEIMTCLPDRNEADRLFKNDAQKRREFSEINDQADQLEDLLSILEVFQNYNTRLTLSSLEEIIQTSDLPSSELFLEQILQNFCNLKFDSSVDSAIEWKNFYWNLQDFRKKHMNMVEAETLLHLAVKCLLFSGECNYICLAIKLIAFKPDRESEKKRKKISESEGKELLRKAAFDYVKFANPSHDSNLELAELCLGVLLQHGEEDDEIKEELDLVNAVQLMSCKFNYSVLPMKIKQIPQPRMVILEGLLRDTTNNYTKVSKLLKLAELLRIHRDHDEQYRQGKVLQIIGEEALRQSDYPVALEVCDLIMERNLEHGWELCKILGRIEDLPEEIFGRDKRLNLLSFALAFCPDTDIDDHFEIINHIRTIKSSREEQVDFSNKNIELSVL